MTLDADILIVGAGLTGLALATELTKAGLDVLVIEGRGRIGGRILTVEIGGAPVDLGPAWFWPGQRRMEALVSDLNLFAFEQFSTGRLVFEAADGAIRRDLDMAPMANALRVEGGLAQVADRLAARAGHGRIMTGHRLTSIASSGDLIAAKVEVEGGETVLTARKVALAAPPRLLEAGFDFTPHLPSAAKAEMKATPTWMAGHAKFVAVYDRPFWREAGLNGDAISHRGPLAEIHDASPMDGARGALFGFIGAPVAQRKDAAQLTNAALRQLGALFGPKATTPVAVRVQDWAGEDLTATVDDHTPPASHPAYRPINSLRNLWGGRLHIASSETAPEEGGFLEGALSAAEAAAQSLLSS